MRPHTAAFIGLLNYLYLKSGDVNTAPAVDGVTYKIIVKTPNTRHYDMRVRSASSYRVELELDGYWSCVAQVNRSGRNFTISHQHTPSTYGVERFDLYPGEHVSRGMQTVKEVDFKSTKIASRLDEFRPNNEILELYDEEVGRVYEVVWDGTK